VPDDAAVTVYIGPLIVADGPDVARIGPEQDRITFGGISLMVSPDRRHLDLHNHGNDRLSCTLISSIESLQPASPAVWLEPHGMVTVNLGIAGSGAPSDGASGDIHATNLSASYFPVLGLETVPIALRVVGARPPESFSPRILPNIMPVAIIAASNGGFALLAIGHILPLGVFFVYETPALILAMFLQRRARARK